MASGIALSTNYTLSKCVGDFADLTSQGPDANETYTNPDNRDADRGPCNTDRRHVFNFTAVAETPAFSNDTLRLLASGWRVAGIYRRSSGLPITVISGTDRALTGGPLTAQGVIAQRPDQVLDNPYGDKSGRPNTRWLNSAAFALPALGMQGNVGRNSVVGPPTWSFDMALSRVFSIGNTERLEARVEAYNVTNSFKPLLNAPAVGLSSQNLSAGTFGVIRDSLDPRILQFALKYVF